MAKNRGICAAHTYIPHHRESPPGRVTKTLILRRDADLIKEDFKIGMQDRKIWKAIVVRGTHSTNKQTNTLQFNSTKFLSKCPVDEWRVPFCGPSLR